MEDSRVHHVEDNESRAVNDSFHASKTGRERKKSENYYYSRIPPSHSTVPVHPDEMHGPPPQVAPYFYYTDKDLDMMSGDTDPRRVVTTIGRPAGHSANHTITKRVATSPLKSCIQNAEVKIARGGVAVSFDPWKSNKKEPSHPRVSVSEYSLL